MSVSVSVEGLDEVRDFTKGVPNALFKSAKEAYGKTIFTVHKKVTARTNDPLNRRTGELARSLKTVLEGSTLDKLTARLYSGLIYAPVHEYGAEGSNRIVAKRAYTSLDGGPFLNIPSRFNKTAAGVQRMSARDVFNSGGFILKLKTSPRAQYAVMLGDGAGDVVPMFWLVKSVEIPPRLGMRDTAKGEVPTLLSDLSKLLGKELNDV